MKRRPDDYLVPTIGNAAGGALFLVLALTSSPLWLIACGLSWITSSIYWCMDYRVLDEERRRDRRHADQLLREQASQNYVEWMKYKQLERLWPRYRWMRYALSAARLFLPIGIAIARRSHDR